jgi:hypothetical protein
MFVEKEEIVVIVIMMIFVVLVLKIYDMLRQMKNIFLEA